MNKENKQVMIHFERGGSFKAALNVQAAPDLCRSVWDVLPIESVATHSRWSGREVNFQFQSRSLPKDENQTIYTSIGELVYWRGCYKVSDDQPAEVLAIYYGPEESRSFRGPEKVSVIGQIDYGQLKELAAVGERIWLHGTEKIRVEKREEQNRQMDA
ncbi:DUF3830 family protein [Ammoniphilus sp. YIM 78166]|uniref:DUF3830 family protein n=1 Tax=Ammoniphilus sp. YIM 78166 TaxID=1644106 RepID=UPI0010702347|nr:DUF3830 family protein [Ammoniphilus sp. YIM 78166]